MLKIILQIIQKLEKQILKKYRIKFLINYQRKKIIKIEEVVNNFSK